MNDSDHCLKLASSLVLCINSFFMKKLVLLVLMNCTLLTLIAQDSLEGNNYFSCKVGRSFPVGDFGSRNVNRINAGLAKNGWSIEAKYAHRFDELFGFSSAFLYAQFPVKNISIGEGPNTSIRPLDYFELLLGPMVTGSIGKKISLDLSVLTGTAYINMTKVNFDGATLAKSYPASAIPLNCSIDFKLRLNNRYYFSVGMDYNYIRANMNVTAQSQDFSFKQSLNTISISLGFGINFK